MQKMNQITPRSLNWERTWYGRLQLDRKLVNLPRDTLSLRLRKKNSSLLLLLLIMFPRTQLQLLSVCHRLWGGVQEEKLHRTEPCQAEADAIIRGDVQNSQRFCLTTNRHDTSTGEEQGPGTLAQSHRKCCFSLQGSLFLVGNSEPTRMCMWMSTWGTYRRRLDRHANQQLRYTHGYLSLQQDTSKKPSFQKP